ncbi:receptor-like protein kinase HSL1 [Populus alba]|uniref:non-specific serine/threonine protein kinase n=1 Tax=Populus alba x Populus x berolinensis TaxID=444605 RepID=A0AAD6VXY6_9ROSI|nr:receptor-like protein kinase HSL1 [Populus alba]KAJ6991519.1 receptor-like protein kinase HSL1 [Populus alba x Populus x berolinensis]
MFFHLSLLFLSLLVTSNSLNQDGLFLQQVKLGLSDPSRALSSWNHRDDTPCGWYGVTCDKSTQRVTSLDLSNSGLMGPFPYFLCRLTNLKSVNLLNNSINSSLTSDIAACQSLEVLNLSENLLVGSLPESLSELKNLKELNLEMNNFSGGIPAKFGEFQKLEWISLTGNLLTGTVPSVLGNISTLQRLLLGYNPFAPGHIPSQLGNLTNLVQLYLAGCNLVGSIPESLGKLSRLTHLDLSLNGLTGSIPSSLTWLKSVEQIELYNNTLSGELPLGFSNLTLLRSFDVSTNELTGTIPNELTQLELESLNLFENRFEGTLPESIAKSPNLYELKLFNNLFTGELPSQLGLNSPLKWLDVSYNGFSGAIPESLCAKGELEGLILIYNSFSGKIPESLGKCNSLGRVRLKNNRFSGIVPGEFWGLPRVYLFELEGNSFSGKVSNRIASAYNLSVLKISKNQFSGNLPAEIGFLDNLIEFSASDNLFTGPIPGSLVNLSSLSTLVLDDNELSGGIPSGIQGWKSLNELSLANNRLSGSIPDEIGSLQVLNYLDLSGNHFSGKIPIQLDDLRLNLLNLSNNMLSGALPPLYAKEMYRSSFVGNPGLCGDLEDLCPQEGDPKKQRYLWILRSIFILAGIVFVVGVVWFYFKYQNLKKAKRVVTASKWRSFHKIGFSEFEILDYLKEDNVIGSGGSGKVYKVVLSNGETVAVKKLSGESKKKDTSRSSNKDEFETEVETLGNIRHKNIVRLWCCCNARDCKLLVYEYMPNGSLGDLLHSSKGGLLDWPTRYKIALDAAEGLSYLHHDCVPPIVHRDVKSNNILLDAEFGARVADFGVAKVFQGVNKGTESMSVIAGSCGYIAPEYAYTVRVNEKSDIYSFGVVILELVTGRLPIDPEFGEKDLVKWVCTTLVDQNDMDLVIDPKLDSRYKDEISEVLDVGLRCTSSLPVDRPSMRRVVKMLQEAGMGNKPKANKSDGKLSRFYHEVVSDQARIV